MALALLMQLAPPPLPLPRTPPSMHSGPRRPVTPFPSMMPLAKRATVRRLAPRSLVRSGRTTSRFLLLLPRRVTTLLVGS